MAIYYKFNLYNTKSIELKKKIEIAERTDGWFTFKNLKVTKKEMEKIENNLRRISYFDKYDYCDSIEVENILINQMEKLPFSFSSVSKASIIGEVIYDKDKNMYVRELITKLVFPIKNKFDYITNLRLIRELKDYTSHYSVVFERGISFSSVLDLNILALNQKVANQNELDEYLKTFDGIFSKRKKKVYYEKLKTLSQENVFKEDVKFLENKQEEPKKEIVRESQSQITKRMESIEYLLDALKNKDEKIYLEYKNKYEELLKLPNLTLVPLSLLEGEIEFYFTLGTIDREFSFEIPFF